MMSSLPALGSEEITVRWAGRCKNATCRWLTSNQRHVGVFDCSLSPWERARVRAASAIVNDP